MSLPRLAVLALGIAAAGCDPDLPADPTFDEHVRPILVANCARCHEAPAIAGAAAFAVTDYDAVREYAQLGILENELLTGRMPPTQPLDGWEIDLVLAWIDAGAPR